MSSLLVDKFGAVGGLGQPRISGFVEDGIENGDAKSRDDLESVDARGDVEKDKIVRARADWLVLS